MKMPEGAFPDDDISGLFAHADQKEKRRVELHLWLGFFVEYCLREGGLTVTFNAEKANLINSAYWEQMHDSVRRKICRVEGKEVRADRHKIASLLELLIMHHKPIEHQDPEIWEDLNARAAFYVATNVIGNWGKVSIGSMKVSDSFTREHKTWLTQLREFPEGWPIFSNAATWYLVELVLIERRSASHTSA